MSGGMPSPARRVSILLHADAVFRAPLDQGHTNTQSKYSKLNRGYSSRHILGIDPLLHC